MHYSITTPMHHVLGKQTNTPTRNATVIVNSETLQVLKLSCRNFQLLVEEGVLTKDVLSLVKEENALRKERTRSLSAGSAALLPARPKPPTTRPPSMKRTESGGKVAENDQMQLKATMHPQNVLGECGGGVKKGGGDTGIDI